MAALEDADPPMDLTSLPPDVLTRILSLLSPQDVVAAACCCHAIKAHAYDEQRIWRLLCEQEYGCHTPVSNWLQPAAAAHLDGPHLFRQLYPVLAAHSAYVGVWHETAAPASPQGAVFSFRWADDGVEVVQLLPRRRYLTQITHKHLCTLGPAHPRYQAVVVDGSKCLLSDFGPHRRHSMPHCGVAEAAASVAVGGPLVRGGCGSGSASSGSGGGGSSSSSSSGVLGSSPGRDAPAGSSPGSAGFCAELTRFMHKTTRPSRRGRRAGSDPPPIIHHFTRVLGPLRAPASKSHPHQLAGLYKGWYRPHGCEMLAVSYDFSGKSASIVATKLTGDSNVPAGKVSWRVSAAPLPLPWPDAEAQLVAQRGGLVVVAAASAANIADAEAERAAQEDEYAASVAALRQFVSGPGHAQALAEWRAQQQERERQEGLPATAQAPADDGDRRAATRRNVEARVAAERQQMMDDARARLARRVVAVYSGQGHIAQFGYTDPSWVEGRLWAYDDGSCGFVWCVEVAGDQTAKYLIDFERLDGDL